MLMLPRVFEMFHEEKICGVSWINQVYKKQFSKSSDLCFKQAKKKLFFS
jgi:hypothetical protein